VIEHLYVIVDHRQVLSRISGRESGLAGACQTRPVFLLRFDFRAPGPTPAAELYEAALDMVEWGEGRGCLSVAVSEHHASEDGYLPSPLVMTAAMATRTTTTPFMIAALLLLMYDPIKLAEDLNVLDHLSRGRVTPIIGLGYRPEEFAMFGVDPARRGAEMEERLEVLQAALAGETVTWRGRTATVRPLPYTPGGTRLAYGGGSPAAARRAARFGLDFIGEADHPELADVYQAEAERVGRVPGACLIPSAGSPSSVFVADDVDAAWDEIGPHLLHDAMTYGEWLGEDHDAVTRSRATTVEELRAEEGNYRIVTPDEAVELVRTHGYLGLQPLCGGLAPEAAWRSLHLIESDVMPRV
jgi:alkanesulfonate monooxygenase SsuD/methylene tetrahydromethanopterin reductase-like flavin-dependent oxidoreductase (luciferase family)